MPLSPADFYAYSQATGAPVADTPEKRAQQAQEVINFRQQQLQAPKQGPGLLDVLGTAALIAGGAAGAYGIGRALRNRSAGQAVQEAVVRDVSPQAAQNVRRAATYQAPAPSQTVQTVVNTPVRTQAPDPWHESQIARSIVNEASQEPNRATPLLPPASARPSSYDYLKQYNLATGRVAPPETLVDQQHSLFNALSDQSVNAVTSSEDQMTGRMKHLLQQDPHMDMSQVELMEEIAEHNHIQGMEQDEPMHQVVQQVVGHDVTPQQDHEGYGVTSQDLADMAKEHMMSLRQDLQNRGLRPGTERFERALSQSWATKSIPGAAPGSTEFRELQDLGKVDIAMPGVINKAVQAVSAGAEPLTGNLKERTVLNIGPNAQVTQTAAGTAIRGATPSYHEALPKQALRQYYGTAEPLVLGAPNELGPDVPGGLRAYGGRPPVVEDSGQGLSRQEIKYSALDRPVPEAYVTPGGPAGIGVYGIESGYVPGAMSKATGTYSNAASRQPSYVHPYIAKIENPVRTGFERLSSEGIQNMLEASGSKGLSPGQSRVAQQELQRRDVGKTSIDLSRTIQGIYASGRPTAHQEVQQLIESLKSQQNLM
jgi:hypothetical protein